MRNSDFAPARHAGWYLAAAEPELQAPITPLTIAGRKLMAIRRDGRYRVYDSVCPHRGASLAHGGTLARAGVICPFHGKAVALGGCADPNRYAVPEVPSLFIGGVLFVALDAEALDDRGFADQLTELARTHDLYPCPPLLVDVAPELVVENAFDLDHFIKVHHISRVTAMDWGQKILAGEGAAGPAFCHAEFTVRTPEWEGGGGSVIQNRFYARAFSPTIVYTELGAVGAGQTVITGATVTERGCIVRVINALRRTPEGPAPAAVVRSLTDFAAKALHDDMLIWEHMDMDMTPRMDRRDAPVIAFREFCDSFAALGSRTEPVPGFQPAAPVSA